IVAVSLDDAYCPAPNINIWRRGSRQCPIFIGDKCMVPIGCDRHIESTRRTKIAVRRHRRLLYNYNAAHGPWFVQTGQTKEFSALLLNRGANTQVRLAGKKFHSVNLLHQPSGSWGRRETKNLLAAAWVCEI